MPWNPAVLEQRIGRIYRLGQEKPIDIYNFIAYPGIEWRIANLVPDKKALFDELLDGSADEVFFKSHGSFLAKIDLMADDDELKGEVKEKTHASIFSIKESQKFQDNVSNTVTHQSHKNMLESDLLPRLRERKAGSPDLDIDEKVSSTLSELTVEQNSDGSVKIFAPANVAPSVAALFEGFAKALRRGEVANGDELADFSAHKKYPS